MARAAVLTCAPASFAPFRKQPDTEPIPGYRLIDPIGAGGFGEVWKCEAPGGLLKAIKFVYGGLSALEGTCAAADDELRAIQRVKAIRHPFLLSMERVELIDAELVIVLGLADQSLHDLLTERRKAGRNGIGRADLLGYLRETAEALDLMNIQHGLQHLDIKPRNLFVCHHVKVGDFGLVNSMALGAAGQGQGLKLGGITPLYASPELFRGAISHASDQYSLALVYHELLTGMLPFNGTNSRQLLLQHQTVPPDLHRLPSADRPAVARALAKVPRIASPRVPISFALYTVAGSPSWTSGPGKPEASPSRETESAQERASKETVDIAVVSGATARRATPKAEVVAGHQLVACVHTTPLTEVWKALSPAGAARVVKRIFGISPTAAHATDGGVAMLRAINHPTLLPFEVLQNTPGRLALATEAAEISLRDRLQECQKQKLAGIPRRELLDYLRPVAEALTELYERHGVQHLGLNPRNLYRLHDRSYIADFGLAQLLWLPGGQAIARLNARYSAPELLRNHAAAACDQYSLALIYHELLTGVALQRLPAKDEPADPEHVLTRLNRLPATDREIIACALDPQAQRRWPSCAALIRALTAAGAGREKGHATAPQSPTPEIAGGEVLKTQFHVPLPLGIIRLRLEAFRSQWNGQIIHDEDTRFVFQMKTPRSLWQRWLGRSPGLEVHIRLNFAASTPPAAADVHVEIKPHDCGRKQSDELLKVIGPLLLESARTYLQVNPRRRAHERFAWQHPLRVCPVGADGVVGAPLECRGKDISLNGIGFYVPCKMGATQVRLHLPLTPQTPAMTVPVRIVRMRDCGDGTFEAGAVLLAAEPGVSLRATPG